MARVSIEPNLEVLVLPYDSAEERSLMSVLIAELRSDRWNRFQSAVAFLKLTGNSPDLLDALDDFACRGNSISMTFGSDVMAGESKGSDYDALEELLHLPAFANGNTISLHHDRIRTFHPKVYLFHHTAKQKAFAIVGSSNWSEGGLVNNVEANVLLRLDLKLAEHLAAFDRLQHCFQDHWTEGREPNMTRRVTLANLARFRSLLRTPEECENDRRDAMSTRQSTDRDRTTAEAEFQGRSLKFPFPHRRRRRRLRITPATNDHETTTGLEITLVYRWSKQLANSDVNQNARNERNLISFGVGRGRQTRVMDDIDDIRNRMLADELWTPTTISGQAAEITTIRVEVRLPGSDPTEHFLVIVHAPHRGSEQSNYHTSMRWDAELAAHFREVVYTGLWASFEKWSNGQYSLTFTEEQPVPRGIGLRGQSSTS